MVEKPLVQESAGEERVTETRTANSVTGTSCKVPEYDLRTYSATEKKMSSVLKNQEDSSI